MKKSFISFCATWLVFLPAHAQFIEGAPFTAIANASVAINNVWAANNNPAGLSFLTKTIVAAGYENKFLTKEFSASSLILALPFNKIVIGGSFQKYGIPDFSQIKTGISLSKSFGHTLSYGIRLNYHQINITGYNNEKTFSADCGIMYAINKKIWLAASLGNISQESFKTIHDQTIGAYIKFGASFLLNEKLTACSQIDKYTDNALDYRMGLDYKLLEILSLRGGLSFNTFRQYAGIGISHKKLVIDLAVSSHPVLSYSPQIALAYEF